MSLLSKIFDNYRYTFLLDHKIWHFIHTLIWGYKNLTYWIACSSIVLISPCSQMECILFHQLKATEISAMKLQWVLLSEVYVSIPFGTQFCNSFNRSLILYRRFCKIKIRRVQNWITQLKHMYSGILYKFTIALYGFTCS